AAPRARRDRQEAAPGSPSGARGDRAPGQGRGAVRGGSPRVRLAPVALGGGLLPARDECGPDMGGACRCCGSAPRAPASAAARDAALATPCAHALGSRTRRSRARRRRGPRAAVRGPAPESGQGRGTSAAARDALVVTIRQTVGAADRENLSPNT